MLVRSVAEKVLRHCLTSNKRQEMPGLRRRAPQSRCVRRCDRRLCFRILREDLGPVPDRVLQGLKLYDVKPNFRLTTRPFQDRDTSQPGVKTLTICQFAQLSHLLYQGGQI